MEPLELSPLTTRWNGLTTRALTGAAAAAIFLIALCLGGFAFTLLIVAAQAIMLREWDALTAGRQRAWRIGGICYTGLACAALIWLRNVQLPQDSQAGLHLVLYVMFIVWATDIGAFFAGRSIGGPKLAPAISPGKTWAGLAGGMAAAALVGLACHSFTPYPFTITNCAWLALLLAVTAQGGDLFESWLKRRAGVKDSGTFLPGHGGLLDRVDGLVFSVPLFACLVATALQIF